MPKNASRAEFKFVIDGVELDDAQRATVARAVQEAGIQALSKFEIGGPVMAVQVGPGLKDFETAGGRVLVGELAKRVAPQIAEIKEIQAAGR